MECPLYQVSPLPTSVDKKNITKHFSMYWKLYYFYSKLHKISSMVTFYSVTIIQFLLPVPTYKFSRWIFIHFLKELVKRICWKSKHFSLVITGLTLITFFPWLCINIVRRKLMLITNNAKHYVHENLLLPRLSQQANPWLLSGRPVL